MQQKAWWILLDYTNFGLPIVSEKSYTFTIPILAQQKLNADIYYTVEAQSGNVVPKWHKIIGTTLLVQASTFTNLNKSYHT